MENGQNDIRYDCICFVELYFSLVITIETHSTKLDEIRNRIAKMFPISNKIEFFARKKIEGWELRGKEL